VRVLTVVGNRPQFIKSAPLSTALQAAGIEEILLHTGQHYDPELSQVFYDELALPKPAYRLDVRASEPERMVPGIRSAIEKEQPEWVLVYGDTNSTVAGTRAAEKTRIAHVEAGLRSFDLTMPEERNRIEVDKVATLLLCPDEGSARQLEIEGVPGRREVVGDVMADAARIFAPIALTRSRILDQLDLDPGAYVLATIHREANVAPERLGPIVAALGALGRRVVLPTHPRTRSVIEREGLDPGAGVEFVAPLGYLDFTALVAKSALVVTDSGGLQKEAYWQRVPCVTVRPSTEWVDTVIAGANVLTEPEGIQSAAEEALRRGFPPAAPTLYGDGHASERVVAALHPALYPSAP
jgi:UDP-GlcNAc3NAcA epimerase